jgi:tRNA pseudouridine55 synthase
MRRMRGTLIRTSTTTMTSQPDVNQSQSGVVVIDKPAGWTSHQVVAKVRRLTNTRKVGHAGTLDPMATGVLLVGIGRATRLLGHLTLTEKAYEATIRLGISTLTDDADGEVIGKAGARGVTDDQIEAALAGLRGKRMQVPSAVSAIKIAGVRSYAKVRAGEDVALSPRPVTIDRLEVVGRRETEADKIAVVDLDVLVECSSGTYVRALARDLGKTLGTGGHLTALRRTRVGPFTLGEAQPLTADTSALSVLSMADVARRCFATLTLERSQVVQIRNGRRLPDVDLPANPTALLSPQGTLLALYRPRAGGGATAEAVFDPQITPSAPRIRSEPLNG